MSRKRLGFRFLVPRRHDLQSAIGVLLGATLLTTGCGTGEESTAPATGSVHQAVSSLGSACLQAADCTSGYCDNSGHCAACSADGDCAEGAVGEPGGEFCSSAGVCTPRKADGMSCAPTHQCSGPGCYAARQCLNGCCDGLDICHGYATGDKLCLPGRRCDDGNPCHTAGTVNTSTFPHSCTAPTVLGDASPCDPDSNVCTTDQCVSGACVHAAGNPGVTCHVSGGDCDSTTACDGASALCPDGLKPSGTVCRPATGGCDIVEECTGTSGVCPPDTAAAAGTVCRTGATTCSPSATCNGGGYVQTLTLTNPSGGAAQTDLQVRLDILEGNTTFWSHLDGGAAATGHDIHVQDATRAELSFWIEQLDPANQRARIWVRVPSVVAPPSVATLTLMYGDSAQPATSDIEETMIFGDEFRGSSIDTTKWIVDDPMGWDVTGNQLVLTQNAGRIHSSTSVSTGMVLETKFQVTSWDHDLAGVMVNGVRNTADRHGDGVQPGLDLGGTQINYWNSFLWTDAFHWSGNYTTTFARSSIAVVGGRSNTSTLTTWSDGANSRSLTFRERYTPSGAGLMLGKRYDDFVDDGEFTVVWDWALIRKYAATPPTLVANADESVNPAAKVCPNAIAGECSADCAGCAALCQATHVSRMSIDPGQPFDVTSDDARVYWTDPQAGVLRSAALDGTSPATLVSGIPGVFGLAIDDTSVYYTDTFARTVSRVPKGGGSPTILAQSQRMPRFLVSDEDHLFWTNQGTGFSDGGVRQYTKSTGSLDTLADRQPGPWTIASIGGQVYWSDVVAGTVQHRASPNDPIEPVFSGLHQPAFASSGSAPHFVSADGLFFDFDATAHQVTARPSVRGGPFSLAASGPSVFWTNGVRNSVAQQLSSADYSATIWKRSATEVPRIARAGPAAIFFSVMSSSGPGSIFSVVPDAPTVPAPGVRTCPPGGTGPGCDYVAATVVPFLECVVETTDQRLIAHFGYTNSEQLTHRMGVGPDNHVDRKNGDACQPTTFAPGTHHDVFAVGFDSEVQWIIGARSATATSASPRCAAGAVSNTEVMP